MLNVVKVSVWVFAWVLATPVLDFCTVGMYLSSCFYNQLLLSRLWLVIFSVVSLNFVAIFLSSIFLYWYSHSYNNKKSKFIKQLFAVFYCRDVINKHIAITFKVYLLLKHSSNKLCFSFKTAFTWSVSLVETATSF